jgi:hypothetical protein
MSKVKLSHYHHAGNNGKSKFSSQSFLTSALDGGEWSASSPGHTSLPGKRTPVPIGQEVGWASAMVWTKRLQDRTLVIQSVVRHYTD